MKEENDEYMQNLIKTQSNQTEKQYVSILDESSDID